MQRQPSGGSAAVAVELNVTVGLDFDLEFCADAAGVAAAKKNGVWEHGWKACATAPPLARARPTTFSIHVEWLQAVHFSRLRLR